MKKAQSAIELVIILGTMMFFFVTLLGTIGQNIGQKSHEKRIIATQNLASNIQKEISIAAGASSGYVRTFKIPFLILGYNYTITINENFLFLQTTDKKIALGLPVQNVTGILVKGDNKIKKLNDKILLNQ